MVSHVIELGVHHTCSPLSIVNDSDRQIYLCLYRHIVLLIGYSLVVLQLVDLLRRGRPSSHLMLVEVQVSPRYVGYALLARGLGCLLNYACIVSLDLLAAHHAHWPTIHSRIKWRRQIAAHHVDCGIL